MWSVLQEEESANETGCELYVNRVLITNHRRLILDQRVSPHTACARIVEIISGQSVSELPISYPGVANPGSRTPGGAERNPGCPGERVQRSATRGTIDT